MRFSDWKDARPFVIEATGLGPLLHLLMAQVFLTKS